MKPIALALGDRYGVGPELAASLLAGSKALPDAPLVVVGDRRVLEQAARSAGVALQIDMCADFSSASTKGWALLDQPNDIDTGPMGRVSAEAGREVLETLQMLARASLWGEICGFCYGPLNKQAMQHAGHAAGDELDYLSRHMPASSMLGEINILGPLWTSRVTSHVPLRAVGDLIDRDRVGRGIALLDSALRQAGRSEPRLAVTALNPHAGEGGLFGGEEIEVIGPAVEDARRRGVLVEGPFPSDTVFVRAQAGDFDGVVTMFHDQGQIALKLMGLGKGITLLAGLPVPAATPGHGTAYDIAGRGMARCEGMRAALHLVAEMARRKHISGRAQ